MTFMSKLALAVPAALMMGAAAPAALAQQPTQLQAAASVSDAEVKVFAETAIELEKTSREWAPKLQSADTAADKKEVQAKMQEAMVATIQESDLTVQRYNQIAQQAQSDQELAMRLNAEFKQILEG